MKKKINKLISKIKGEDYKIDENIPTYFLNFLVLKKTFELIRGFFTKIFFSKKGKFVFIGSHTKILCKSKIKCGRGFTIGDYCYINALSKSGINIGDNVSIGRNSIIECTGVLREIGEGLFIGNNVGISSNAFIGVRGKVTIGNDTIVGPFLKIHAENHSFNDINTPIRLQKNTRIGVQIGSDCWIGSNVTILDGVVIGNKCVIGSGSVVVKNIPDFSVCVGVPAKIIRNRRSKI